MSFQDLSRLSLLRLLQLADSALPVGSAAHSFGLESLVADEDIESGLGECPRSLAWFIEDSLSESLLVDAVYCREAHTRALTAAPVSDLNRRMSALRLARESREASLALGRRFAAFAYALHPLPPLSYLAEIGELHHPVAFGYAMGALAVEPDTAVAAFLQQSVSNTISAGQRLLPLGQTQAGRIAWDLKPAILEAVNRSRTLSVATVGSFAHLPEMASMRHSRLATRLFIS